MVRIVPITEMTETVAPVAQVSLSIIVPTYKEVENIPHLIERLEQVRQSSGMDLEVLLMDDDSKDGSAELVEKMGLPWVRLITRTADRGLSAAVLDGLGRAEHQYLAVMDADLSHPPEKLPEMITELRNGADFVVGSRFAKGGTTDDDWGLFRWLNSRVATVLAMPLCSINDPMSGFFAMERGTFLRGTEFSPVGYKIGLELLLKCRCHKVVEVPIHFSDRQFGQSKLSLKEQIKYLQHVRRLYIFKYGTWSHFVQFGMVGISGVVVNLAVLTVALQLHATQTIAIVLGAGISMVTNFLLNRRFSFSYARSQYQAREVVGFVAACGVGFLIQVGIAAWMASHGTLPQLASLVGIAAGMIFNFLAARFLVFKQEHIKPK
jgi:dolichol-phosphate mannosyltransferase